MASRALVAVALLEAHPSRAATVLEQFPPEEASAVLGQAEARVAARVVTAMAPFFAAACVAASSPEAAAGLLGAMPTDLAAIILRRAPRAVVTRLLADLPPTRAGAIRRLLAFPEGTVGALADPLAPALPLTMCVGDAATWLRSHPDHASHVLFVLDRDHQLAGVVPMHVLVVGAASDSLEDVMRPAALVFQAGMAADTARASPVWATQLVAPVVDHEGRFLGGVSLAALRRYVESRPEEAGGAALGTIVRLGELYWSAWGRLLTELASAVTHPRGPSGGGHDRRHPSS